MVNVRVAVIGAGIAGLASAKYAKEKGLDCVVFEQWSEIGGVWVYTDYTDFDEYGYPVLSAMYKQLKTNLPRQIMGFSDFPIPEKEETFLSNEEIRDFLNLYADHFDLKPLIKVNTVVTLIKPMDGTKWMIETEYKINKRRQVDIFDAVMICSGHNHSPRIPDISGIHTFKGEAIHSRMYRKAENYKGKIVLIIGGGFSGIELVEELSKTAKTIIFNYREVIMHPNYQDNVIIKQGEINGINDFSVTFSDGSTIIIDCIIYCTGYYYKYPFLDKYCNIIDGDFVQPLYKHVININKPTMAFIGVVTYVCPAMTYELQARFFIHTLLGIAKLSTQEDMRRDMELDFNNRHTMGYTGRKYHKIHDNQKLYYTELATIGKTHTIPQIMIDIYDSFANRCFNGRGDFKKDRVTIIDDKTFIYSAYNKLN